MEIMRNSTPFFGAVAFCTTKIDDLQTTCPCQSQIQRLHYPAFAAFFNNKSLGEGGSSNNRHSKDDLLENINTKLNFRNVTNTEIVKDNIITVWLIIVAILKL